MSGKKAKQSRATERELILINIAGVALAKDVSAKKRIKAVVGLLVNQGIISLRNYQPSEELLNDGESDEPGGVSQVQSGADEKPSSQK